MYLKQMFIPKLKLGICHVSFDMYGIRLFNCARAHTYTHIRAYTHLYTHSSAHTHTHTRAYTFIHTRARTHKHTPTSSNEPPVVRGLAVWCSQRTEAADCNWYLRCQVLQLIEVKERATRPTEQLTVVRLGSRHREEREFETLKFWSIVWEREMQFQYLCYSFFPSKLWRSR